MKAPFTQKLDSDQIRQGLLSIRNTQLQLLNQLKYETEILKNYSPPSTCSQYSEKAKIERKWDRFPPFSIEPRAITQDNNIIKLSQSDQQLSQFNEKELRDQLTYFKNENKLLSSNFQKAKRGSQADKEVISELQATLQFSSKLFYDILLRILEDANLNAVRQFILSQICKVDMQKPRVKSYFDQILILLSEKEKKQAESTKLKAQIQSEKDIANQLIDLKSQISLLLTHSNHNANNANELQLSKVRKQMQQKNRLIEEYSSQIKKIQNQKKELKQLWEKELNERIKLTGEWQKMKKQSNIWEQKEKKIIFYAKDMENRAIKAQKTLKEKEKTQLILKQNASRLTEAINVVRQSNQCLRLEVKSLEQTKQNKYQSLLEQKTQLENQLQTVRYEQQKLLQKKEIELHSLKSHLIEIKKDQEAFREIDRKNKDIEIIQQDIYRKKVNIIRTNSTIDHLWQVKEVQYQNILELIAKMKK